MTLKNILLDDLKQYLTSMSIDTEEAAQLKRWVKAGNSPYTNPWFYSDETGAELDFVSALRVNEKLCEESGEMQIKWADMGVGEENGAENELPF